MKIEYDPNKSQRNIEERNLSFDEVAFFEWQTAIIWQDNRFNYPEPRFLSLGLLGDRVHSICFTPIQNGIRVISFRKANKREVRKYEQERAIKL
ncbi:hypothetical protein BKK51_05275 [Rodentibacter trehalosifermentans]|uniref:BrnT family toxin n=1 Tax=Rodentibacter trehalosifermentans TaxID=1908263 RepID=A0A1V3IU90_9PAST|nr:BrnT family toxin [Rodentibacter trehalosifermentans]OOF45816.1 hypothetical protein BKK51_05275 [Rodentibacter trehalosifermentans]